MKTLTELRKYMYDRREAIDLEDGETFKQWWETYKEALREDGQLVVINNRTYVKD